MNEQKNRDPRNNRLIRNHMSKHNRIRLELVSLFWNPDLNPKIIAFLFANPFNLEILHKEGKLWKENKQKLHVVYSITDDMWSIRMTIYFT